MSCERNHRADGYPICSGHGDCVQDLCICEKGWTSITDFMSSENYDCDIDIKAIRIWSLINIVLSVISFAAITFLLRKEGAFTLNRMKSIKFISFAFGIFTNWTSLPYIIGKYLNPEVYYIGGSAMASISVCATIIGTCLVGSSFIIIMINFLQGYSRMLNQDRRMRFKSNALHIRRMALVFPCFVTMWTSAIFIMVHQLPERHMGILNGLNLGLMALDFLVYAICIEYLVLLFLKEITSYLRERLAAEERDHISPLTFIPTSPSLKQKNSTKTTVMEIKSKIQALNLVLLPFLVTGFLITTTFASWSFLRRHSTYFLLQENTLLHILGPMIFWSLSTTSKITPLPASSKLDSDSKRNGIVIPSIRLSGLNSMFSPHLVSSTKNSSARQALEANASSRSAVVKYKVNRLGSEKV
jgi:hypothetical protein